jgi:valyl-tRNA synthetase
MQSLHLGHLYGMYTKDYYLKMGEMQTGKIIHHMVVFQPKNILSVSAAQQFFAKRYQTLQQVGKLKLCNYLLSRKEKGTKANIKRWELAFGEGQIRSESESDFSLFVQEFLQKAQKEKKILVKKNIAYWSVDLQTTIPLDQIVFRQEQGKSYTVKYFIEMKNDVLSVCVSTPDLIFGDVALLVHPEDRRYKKLIGKRVIVPVVNRTIPVIGDVNVDISKDHGIKRVCPCYDQESIALAEKHNLPLDRYVFTADGNYTKYAGDFAGKPRKEFYVNILQYLDDICNF